MRSKEAADILNKRLICFNRKCRLDCTHCEYFVSDEEMIEAWEYAIERLYDDEYIHMTAEAVVKVSNAILKLIEDVMETQEVKRNEEAENDSLSPDNGYDDGNADTGGNDK